jgi:hypothetical protein
MAERLITKSGWIFLMAVMLIALGVRSMRINAPFTNLHESDGTIYGNEFRNWHRYGLKATHFYPSRTAGKSSPEKLIYHVVHWPLPHYIVYATQKLLGIDETHIPEWSIRIVSISLGVLTLPVLFIVLRLLGLSALLSGFAVSFAALSTGHIYFSQSTGGNFPITYFFMVLTFWRYLLWTNHPWGKETIWFGLTYFASLYCMWEAYYLFPTILIFHTLTGRPHLGKLVVLMAIVTAGAAGLYLWHVSLLPNADTLAGRFQARSSVATFLSPLSYFGRIAYRYLFYYSVPLALASFYWLIHIIGNWKDSRRQPVQMFGVSLLFLGLCDVVLLSNAYFHHHYFMLSLFPFAVVSSTLGIGIWMRRRDKVPWKDPVIVLLMCVFLVQSAYCIHRRFFHHIYGYPVTYELSRSIAKHTEFGEEVLTDLNVFDYYIPFYADSLLVHRIDSNEKMISARKKYPDRHFRYLVTSTPELAKEGIGLFRKLKSRGEDLKDVLRFHNISPNHNRFHHAMAQRYMHSVHPPFIYYDLDTPKSEGELGRAWNSFEDQTQNSSD